MAKITDPKLKKLMREHSDKIKGEEMKIVQPPTDRADSQWTINGEKVQVIAEALVKVAELAKRNLQKSNNSGSLVLKANEDGEIDADAYDLLHNVLKQTYGSVKVRPIQGGVEFRW